jgi:peroxiredoxin
VELQQQMPTFDAAGIAVYALSYDEPDALTDFAQAHRITYTLLADPTSKIIREFGILNTLIDPSDHPWYGVPYPGTYVLDSTGTVTHKFFDSNLAVRAGPEQLLRAAQGQQLLESAPVERAPGQVQVSIALDGPALVPTVQRDLLIRLQVPPGRHLYADPAPAGSVPVSVTLERNDSLVLRPLIRPPSAEHQLADTDEAFEVHDGLVELRLPLTISGKRKDQPRELTVAGEVRWQCCDDKVCDIPERQRFELQLPLGDSPDLALGSTRGAKLEPNAAAHFQRMSARRRGDG